MNERAHALLSASSAKRWINCPPSARMNEKYPDETSEFAEEGTRAHKIAELTLEATRAEATEASEELKALGKAKECPNEMFECAEAYRDYILEKAGDYAVILTEQRVDFSQWVPEGFGTADCIVIGNGALHIFDYKYGKGVKVEAAWNPQLMLYALGAYEIFEAFYDIESVQMHICQPRMDNFSSFGIPTAVLMKWGEEIREIARTAWEGKGEPAVGAWCKFCKASAVCKAKADYYTAIAGRINEDPHCISLNEIGEILDKTEGLEDWIKSLRVYALGQILKGEKVQGYKCTQGTSRREFKSKEAEDEAFRIAESQFDSEMLYEKKRISLAQLEKLFGKKEFKETLGELVRKPEGKPQLSKEDSDKPEWMPSLDAETDFEDIL